MPDQASTPFRVTNDDTVTIRIGDSTTVRDSAGQYDFTVEAEDYQLFEAYLVEYIGEAKLMLSWNNGDGIVRTVPTEAFIRVDDERVLNMSEADSLEPIDPADQPVEVKEVTVDDNILTVQMGGKYNYQPVRVCVS